MPRTLTATKSAAGRAFADAFKAGQRVCLTTHVNPDGDGLGSEVGLLHLLRARGIDCVITNPTPTPSRFASRIRCRITGWSPMKRKATHQRSLRFMRRISEAGRPATFPKGVRRSAPRRSPGPRR